MYASPAPGMEAAISRLASCDAAALQHRLREVLDLAVAELAVSGAIVERCDGDDLVYVVASQALMDKEGFRLRRKGSLSGWAVQSGASQYCADSDLDGRVDRAACRALGLRSMVCSPLEAGGETLVLKFMAPTPHSFDPARLDQIKWISERLEQAFQTRQPGHEDVWTRARSPSTAPRIVPATPDRATAVSSRHLLDSVQQMGGIGWWTLDPSNLDMLWSEALCGMLDVPTQHVVPRLDDLLAWTHPADRNALHKFLTGGGAADPVTARIHQRDRDVRWLRFSCEPKLVADRVRLGAAQDVTALHSVQSGLARYEAAFEALAEFTGGMIWRADAQGSLSFGFDWCAFTGTTLAQNQGVGWLDQLHPDDRALTAQTWCRSRDMKTPFAARFRVRRQDGAYALCDCRTLTLGVEPDFGCVGVTMPVDRIATPPNLPAANEGLARPRPRELKAMRALADWTIEDLAAKSGVSVSTITRYERGDLTSASIRPANLDRLALALSHRGVQLIENDEGRCIRQPTAI